MTITNSEPNKTWITSSARQNGKSYWYDLYKKYLEEEEKRTEQFKREYLGEWIDKNPTGFTLFTWNKIANNIIKLTEEPQTMNCCEFTLGDVFVAKDEISNINSGQALIVAPGYDKENFDIVAGKKGIVVTVYKQCADCGDINGQEEFIFNYNEYFEVVGVSSELINGVLTIQVDYDTESNVEILDVFDYIDMADQIENESSEDNKIKEVKN